MYNTSSWELWGKFGYLTPRVTIYMVTPYCSDVEVLPDRQYLIKVDGSGRVTKRNRKFLRKIHPCLRKGHAFIPSPLDANAKESEPTQQESPEILMPNTPRRVSFAGNSPLVTPRTSESSTLSDQTKQIPLALKRLKIGGRKM